MGKTVTAAYARANLPALLNAVAAGKSITILRYNKPVADLIPSAAATKPAPQFGTGRDKWKIIDPNWAAPMTDEEADAFLKGRS
jgi:antitoxin (DNA-binding transcriptional repressor) of toxin-antitoxin stability system